MKNVISLSDKTKDARHQSPEQCLNRALKDIGKVGALEKGSKILVICLDDNDDEYNITWYQAGMRMSQCVALARITEQCFMNELGYNTMPGDPV